MLLNSLTNIVSSPGWY